MSDRRKVPRFHGLRIYLVSVLIYFLLVMPIALFLLAKYGPNWMAQQNRHPQNDTEQTEQEFDAGNLTKIIPEDDISLVADSVIVFDTTGPEENINIEVGNDSSTQSGSNKFNTTVITLIKLLMVSFLLGLAFNLPFKIYFSKKRKNKPIPEKLHKFCKKFLLKVPVINVGILFISFGITLIYMLFILIFTNTFDEITQRFFLRFFIISLVSTILTLLFVYFWEKHRVHLRYIDHVYSTHELRKRIFKVKAGKVRFRLWTSNAMTTLLPLFIVMFYLLLSVSTLRETGIENPTPEQLKILFGNYLAYFSSIQINLYGEFFYVNVLDSLLMFSGIFTGIIIAVIYLLFFVTWTTRDIVEPVRELLVNMQATGRGEINQYSIVRTNDELGVLTEGYNDMARRINEYIESISKINEANSRFVPKQFLEFLQKENIADIHLGDQVQKEMSILFADIRNFTGISEEMTPRENFNFLNNYLGYMEPVIRNNQGFVDKYIGDSIMALFSDKAEDAINAAIEMQIKLVEFNHVISQFGKPPIQIGIGIHTGNLMLGIVGGEGRMDGTVISDAVNLTSRLEGLTKLYGASIIMSEDTLIRLNDPSQYNYRFLDIVKVKGKKEAVYIFEILDGEKEESKLLKIKTKSEFSKALQLYKNMQFEKALELFITVFSENPEDLAANIYIQRCKKILREGVSENWDGIEKIENKYD